MMDDAISRSAVLEIFERNSITDLIVVGDKTVKQHIYDAPALDVEPVVHAKWKYKELGDCCWMIAEACRALDATLEDVMRMNIDKLKARYPEGFDPERSLHRAEGDV